MDVSVINPFISATVSTFDMMLSSKVEPGSPMLKKDDSLVYDISGIIGLSGNAQGTIALSFTKTCALKAISQMLGMELKIVGPELSDGIGEIANIVAGSAKAELTNYNLSISLPNVVIGHDHLISVPTGTPVIIVPFSSPFGNFSMEVALKTKS